MPDAGAELCGDDARAGRARLASDAVAAVMGFRLIVGRVSVTDEGAAAATGFTVSRRGLVARECMSGIARSFASSSSTSTPPAGRICRTADWTAPPRREAMLLVVIKGSATNAVRAARVASTLAVMRDGGLADEANRRDDGAGLRADA